MLFLSSVFHEEPFPRLRDYGEMKDTSRKLQGNFTGTKGRVHISQDIYSMAEMLNMAKNWH